jgi:ATP adenylyltransferase
MKRLYAPWRQNYVTGMTTKSGDPSIPAHTCVFCKQLEAREDEKYFIVKRFKHSAIMMNRYPYNAGHILILPYEHKAELPDLTQEARAEMMEVVALSLPIVGKILQAEGFNVGINLGVAGGGGIPSHLHIHVLPRWRGDTNFLETLGETKVISSDITKIFKELVEGFASV